MKPLCAAEDDGCSERAEIWERTELRVPYDQGVWYGFAVKFADPIPTDDHRYLIAQWKREIDPGAEGDFSPFLALRVRNGKLFATVETNYIAPGRQRRAKRRQRLQGRGGAGLVQTGDQPDAGAGGDRRGLERRRQRPLPRLHHAITVDRPRQQAAAAVVGMDRLRDLHKAGAGRPRPYRDLANGKPIVTVKGQSAMPTRAWQEPVFQVRSVPGRSHTTDWTLYYDDFRRSPRCADVMGESQCPLP